MPDQNQSSGSGSERAPAPNCGDVRPHDAHDWTGTPSLRREHCPGKQVVLSGERHYFGFQLWTLWPPNRCRAAVVPGLRNRCGDVAEHQVRFAYVRERDQHSTYVSEPVCWSCAQRFAKRWGITVSEEMTADA